MTKEIIEMSLEEFSDFLYESYSEDEYEEIKTESVYQNLEKGYEDKEIIIKRISDGKFFKFEYSDSPHHSITSRALNNENPIKGVEVFPEIITKVIYK